MTKTDCETPRLHALLIGVNCYLPNELPRGSYPSLRAPVRDVQAVASFLRTRLKLPDEDVRVLTSTDDGKGQPVELPELRPTYENIVREFRDLAARAGPGDQVCIYYSGHGGRARTTYPELKSNGLDEVLVPCDIGNSEARYLRDLEMAFLLQGLVSQGLIVTVILDSCFSGGATKDLGPLGAAPKGVDFIDDSVRPVDSLVASSEELRRTWEALTAAATAKDIQAGAGWLPEPKGYVLVAACQPHEKAFEKDYGEDGRYSALTYWLLDGLKRLDNRTTYRQVFGRVNAKVHGEFAGQTPVLLGEGDRTVFGADRIVTSTPSIFSRSTSRTAGLRLMPGRYTACARGQVRHLRPRCDGAVALEGRLALAELTDLGSTTSRLKLTERFEKLPIEEGCKAVLIEPGVIPLRRRVRLLPAQPGIQNLAPDPALAAVAEALKHGGRGWAVLAGETEPADLHVSVDGERRYVISDEAAVPLPNLRPMIGVGEKRGGRTGRRIAWFIWRNITRFASWTISTAPS